MNPALSSQFVLQQRVNKTVPGGLHFRLEGFGCDDEAEMCLGGGAALHRLVVPVEMRVVVDLERGGLKSRGNLKIRQSMRCTRLYIRDLSSRAES